MKILPFISVFMAAQLLVQHGQSQETYSPYVDQNYPRQVYWGDTHVHTSMSTDAFASPKWGLNRVSPDEAYAFARGETVVSTSGQKVRLSRPLDFLVLADHAENIGVFDALATADPAFMRTPEGSRLYDFFTHLEINSYEAIQSLRDQVSDMFFEYYNNNDIGFRRSMWSKVISNAESNNDPGRFTAFVGYEWTGTIFEKPGSSWYHRVVIYKDGEDKVSKVLPFSQIDSQRPEDLWQYLADYEASTGGEALAIPHNPNLSGGRTFRPIDSDGQQFTAEYAATRSRWEPLLEVTQFKGDSETHPYLSPTDEFAVFERWYPSDGATRSRDPMKYEYARSGLQLGLAHAARLGVNPFKLGLIGSTDSHNSLAAAEESNFFGKNMYMEPNNERFTNRETDFQRTYERSENLTANAAGYAAVWAMANTREAVFAAMKRREVYASTGPRIEVRFFGGWDYQKDDAFRHDLAEIGYSKGIPMGGDLTMGPNDKSPSFLIRAVKDPDGANLDRVQVIKGWLDGEGRTHEKIYNVGLSDGREPLDNGTVSPVGNTVDIPNASYTNTIGDPVLAVVWVDPDFNKDEYAFYYLRVLEIPTPRWTAYDAKFYKFRKYPDEIPMITQERAYTSPIWYTPSNN